MSIKHIYSVESVSISCLIYYPNIILRQEIVIRKNRNGIYYYKSNVCIIAFSLAFSLFFLLVHSRGTSPLYPIYYYGKDSIYYIYDGVIFLHSILTGHATTNISTLTVIQAIGQLVFSGKIGAFIVQLFSLSIFFAIVIIYLNQNIIYISGKFFVFLSICAYLGLTIGDGNFGEEFALPFLIYAYISFRNNTNILSEQNKTRLKQVIIGIIFALLLNLKVITVATICAIIFADIIDSLLSKEWLIVIKKALTYLGGVLIIAVPYSIYGIVNNNLQLILSRYFFSGIKYSSSRNFSFSDLSRYDVFFFSFLLVPILFSLILLRIVKYDRRFNLFIVANAIIIFIAINSGHHYSHYLMINVITLLIALSEFIKELYKIEKKSTSIKLIQSKILLSILWSSLITILLVTIILKIEDINIFRREYKKADKPFVEISNQIPPEQINDVLLYNVTPSWFYVNQTIPIGDYTGIWMTYYASINPAISAHFVTFLDFKPKWVLVRIQKDSLENEKMIRTIEEKYEAYYKISYSDTIYKDVDGSYILFKKKK